MLVVSGSIWGGGCLPLFPPQQVRTSPGNRWISAVGSGCLGIEGVCRREVVAIARGCWDQSSLLVHNDSVKAACPSWARCLFSSYFLCKWRRRRLGWPQQGFQSPSTKPHSLTGIFSLLDSWKSENWRGRTPPFRVIFLYNYFRDTICNIKTKNLPPLQLFHFRAAWANREVQRSHSFFTGLLSGKACVRAERCPAAFHAL